MGGHPSPIMMSTVGLVLTGESPQMLDGRVTRRKKEHRQRDGRVAETFPFFIFYLIILVVIY